MKIAKAKKLFRWGWLLLVVGAASPYLVWVVTSKLFNCFEIDLLVRPKQIEIGCVASSNSVDYGMVVGLLQQAKTAMNSGVVYYLLVGAALLAITNVFMARSERLNNAKA